MYTQTDLAVHKLGLGVCMGVWGFRCTRQKRRGELEMDFGRIVDAWDETVEGSGRVEVETNLGESKEALDVFLGPMDVRCSLGGRKRRR